MMGWAFDYLLVELIAPESFSGLYNYEDMVMLIGLLPFVRSLFPQNMEKETPFFGIMWLALF